MSFDDFVSDGRVFVEMLRPALCLMINKTMYGSCVADCSVGS